MALKKATFAPEVLASRNNSDAPRLAPGSNAIYMVAQQITNTGNKDPIVLTMPLAKVSR